MEQDCLRPAYIKLVIFLEVPSTGIHQQASEGLGRIAAPFAVVAEYMLVCQVLSSGVCCPLIDALCPTCVPSLGENYLTEGYVVTPKTMDLLQQHLKETGGMVCVGGRVGDVWGVWGGGWGMFGVCGGEGGGCLVCVGGRVGDVWGVWGGGWGMFGVCGGEGGGCLGCVGGKVGDVWGVCFCV